MVSGGKTTLCNYSMLFSPVIYREKTARSDFGQGRPDRVVFETKWLRLLHTKRYESYQLIRMVCVGIVIYQSSSLPFFFFPLQPLLLSIYLSNSPPPQTNKLFEAPAPSEHHQRHITQGFLLNIGRPSSRPIRYVTLYRPAHRADRVTSNGSII